VPIRDLERKTIGGWTLGFPLILAYFYAICRLL